MRMNWIAAPVPLTHACAVPADTAKPVADPRIAATLATLGNARPPHSAALPPAGQPPPWPAQTAGNPLP